METFIYLPKKMSILIRKDGDILSIKHSLSEAAEYLGMSKGGLSKALREKRRMRNGYEVEIVGRTGEIRKEMDGFRVVIMW